MEDLASSIVFLRTPADLVIAYGGGDGAAWVLQQAGFVPVATEPAGCHRLPTGMTDRDEQRACVAKAASFLAGGGYRVRHDAEFAEAARSAPAWEPQESDLAGLAHRIDSAHHTRDIAAVLAELTAPYDGAMSHIALGLERAAAWWHDFGTENAATHAAGLTALAHQVRDIQTSATAMRTTLADAHTAHPHCSPQAGETRADAARSTSAGAPKAGATASADSPYEPPHLPPPTARPASGR